MLSDGVSIKDEAMVGVRVCACERERERERKRVGVPMSVHVSACEHIL